jgi:hypothetical protein
MPETSEFYCQGCQALIVGTVIHETRRTQVVMSNGRAHSVIRDKWEPVLTRAAEWAREKQKAKRDLAIEEKREAEDADLERELESLPNTAASNSGADVIQDVLEVTDVEISQDSEGAVEDSGENSNFRLDEYFKRARIG